MKHAAEEITSEKLSDMLTADCNNMFTNIRHRTKKNSEAITQLKQARMTDQNLIKDMTTRFNRLSEYVKEIII